MREIVTNGMQVQIGGHGDCNQWDAGIWEYGDCNQWDAGIVYEKLKNTD